MPRLVLRKRPQPYPTTKPQAAFAEAVKACGIKKGMSRDALMRAMKECIPQWFRSKMAAGEKSQPPSSVK